MQEFNSTKNLNSDPRRQLPSVSDILNNKSIISLIEKHSRIIVLDVISQTLNYYRENLKENNKPPSFNEVIKDIEKNTQDLDIQKLRPVVNATGIILHTNLGRAFLPEAAVNALSKLNHCCNVQTDMKTGLRGKRHFYTEYLLTKITGAEAALVVNNNAAATFLILSALAKNKEVIISRGQLIEIGGSYRLPDCIHQSGAIMVDVGTTNKTHLYDYERAIIHNTGIILRCNPSNYRIVGFTEEVSIKEIVSLKKIKSDIIVVDDLGCGAIIDLSKYGFPKEPTVQESILAGADLVCFSGDKLISGPQAGIIVGKKELIGKIKKHPLTRMLRICKLTDIALQETLNLFLNPEKLHETNPTIRMLTTPLDKLKTNAENLKTKIENYHLPFEISILEDFSETGGGSLPAFQIKTYVLAIKSNNLTCDKLAYLFRKADFPIIVRIKDGQVLLDMRTLLDDDDEYILNALIQISRK